MKHIVNPSEVKLEITVDTSKVYQYVSDKSEFDDGILACYSNETYSKDWTRSKQAGYFMGRIIRLAMITEGIEKDMHNWTKDIEENNANYKKMKLTPNGTPYIEEQQ